MAIWQHIRSGDWLTAGRLRGYALILVVAYIAAAALWIALADGLIDRNGKPLGTDFSNVYAAGSATTRSRCWRSSGCPRCWRARSRSRPAYRSASPPSSSSSS
jgi:hypothetical protein